MVNENKEVNVSTRAFFSSRAMKVLIFPYKRVHRILTTKLPVISSYHSHNCTFLLSNIRANDVVPVYTEILYRTDVHRLTYYCQCSLWKRRQNQLIPVNPTCPKEIPNWQATPWGRAQPPAGLSGPATLSGSLRAKAQSAAALPRLQRLAQFEALSTQKWAGVSGWNSWLIYIKSLFMFILFFVLVHKRTAWM